MPFARTQSVLKKALPSRVFERLYQKACNAYDIYACVKNWGYYHTPSTVPSYRQDKKWLRLVSPYSMVSREGLTHTLDVARRCVRGKVPGAFVECGVARGGCSALLALVARDENLGRQTRLFDSFEGLPAQSEWDGQQKPVRHKDRRANDLAKGYCYGSLEDVEGLFDCLDLTANTYMVKGWFQDTLPKYREQVGDIAVLRLDGDWYESTKCCLENLYGNVVDGGYVIIDDYSLPGCKLAVDEFIASRGLKVEMLFDKNGRAYWSKA